MENCGSAGDELFGKRPFLLWTHIRHLPVELASYLPIPPLPLYQVKRRGQCRYWQGMMKQRLESPIVQDDESSLVRMGRDYISSNEQAHEGIVIGMAVPVASNPTFWSLAMEDNLNTTAFDSNTIFFRRPASAPVTSEINSRLFNTNHCQNNTPPGSTIEDINSWSASPVRICENCHATQTPFWRRSNDGRCYCNACGLYLRAHKKMRPISLQMSRNSKRIKARADICSNCQAKETPLWRRISSGETVCNACGLYFKLHGAHRPLDACKGLPATRGSGKKSRVLLPKYSVDTSWHQYYPPEAVKDPSETTSFIHPPHFQQNHISIYGSSGTLRPTTTTTALPPPNGVDFVQYAMLNSVGTPTGAALFMPGVFTFSESTTNHQSSSLNIKSGGYTQHHHHHHQQQQQQPNNRIVNGPNDSLDDSMRWFSSTCLETEFHNPTHH